MTGRTVTTIIVVILLIVAGFWLFGRDNGEVAQDPNTTSTSSGIGGPEEGFDPLEDLDMENSTTSTSSDASDLEFSDKG